MTDTLPMPVSCIAGLGVPVRVLSLGAGVQSSTLALMIARGEIPPVECAIFADTGAEPPSVYRWLDWLEKELPFPVHRVMEKDGLTARIENACSERKTRTSSPPLFTAGGGVATRQCTLDFKIEPIRRFLRAMVQPRRGESRVLVDQLIGISLDEVHRMKPSRDKWARNSWPLVDAGMKRHDCLRWMEAHGYPVPPRSACVYCPYRSNAGWRAMRDSDPAAWAEACRMDEVMRDSLPGMKEAVFVHRSRLPLRDVDLSTDFERGQGDLFGNECEGMCGL